MTPIKTLLNIHPTRVSSSKRNSNGAARSVSLSPSPPPLAFVYLLRTNDSVVIKLTLINRTRSLIAHYGTCLSLRRVFSKTSTLSAISFALRRPLCSAVKRDDFHPRIRDSEFLRLSSTFAKKKKSAFEKVLCRRVSFARVKSNFRNLFRYYFYVAVI